MGVSVSVGPGVGAGVVAVAVGGNGVGEGVLVGTTATGGSTFSVFRFAVGNGVEVRSMTTSTCKASIVAVAAADSWVSRSGLFSFSNNKGNCSKTGTDPEKSLPPQDRNKDQPKISKKATSRKTGKSRRSNEKPRFASLTVSFL